MRGNPSPLFWLSKCGAVHAVTSRNGGRLCVGGCVCCVARNSRRSQFINHSNADGRHSHFFVSMSSADTRRHPDSPADGMSPYPRRSPSLPPRRGRRTSTSSASMDSDSRSPSRSPSRHPMRSATPSSSSSYSKARPRSRSRSPSRSPSPSRRTRSPSFTPDQSASPSPSIKVTGLTKLVATWHLEEIFSAYGSVRDALLPTFQQSGEPKGHAWILFASVESAEKAISHMDQGQIDGAVVSVKFDRMPRPRPRDRIHDRRELSPRGYAPPPDHRYAPPSARGHYDSRYAPPDSRAGYYRNQDANYGPPPPPNLGSRSRYGNGKDAQRGRKYDDADDYDYPPSRRVSDTRGRANSNSRSRSPSPRPLTRNRSISRSLSPPPRRRDPSTARSRSRGHASPDGDTRMRSRSYSRSPVDRRR